MSAFLGPIHYWVYNKIRLQEELVRDILTASEENNWNHDLEDKLSEICGTISEQPLEDIIDYQNIHGWLQSKIAVTEGRLSLAVAELLKDNEARKEELVRIAGEFGRKHSIPSEADAEDAFQVICDSLIDGMPCDHVNEVLEQGESHIRWQQTQCVHFGYWEQVNTPVEVYYELRKAIIKGMLTESKITFQEREDGTYELV